ncbi:MAG: hypothetical protein SGI84_01935 [Gemmatimonadota bacterium]|nr:hypothetical protein [Gemmatimonadota bacterium]
MPAAARWLVVLGLLLPVSLTAQSAQRLSVQGSGALLFGSRVEGAFEGQTRLGYEAQLRYTASRLSVGAGYQRSTVYSFQDNNVEFTAALSLGFIEPRYVVAAGNRAAAYVAGRLGYGTLVCSEECNANDGYLTYGGGGGVLIRLGGRAAIDLGGQYFTASDTFASGYLLLRVGLSVGL